MPSASTCASPGMVGGGSATAATAARPPRPAQPLGVEHLHAELIRISRRRHGQDRLSRHTLERS
jgi:hypothetical protein